MLREILVLLNTTLIIMSTVALFAFGNCKMKWKEHVHVSFTGASKKTQSCMRCILKEIFNDFLSMDHLEELGHGFDTLCNESMNNTVAWLAPKNKFIAQLIHSAITCPLDLVFTWWGTRCSSTMCLRDWASLHAWKHNTTCKRKKRKECTGKKCHSHWQ